MDRYRPGSQGLHQAKRELVERGVDPIKGPFEVFMRTKVALEPRDDQLFALN